jgi:hypothetical protein
VYFSCDRNPRELWTDLVEPLAFVYGNNLAHIEDNTYLMRHRFCLTADMSGYSLVIRSYELKPKDVRE